MRNSQLQTDMDLVPGIQNADRNPAPRTGNPQAMATGLPPNAMNRAASKQVNFALLIPELEQQLDKDRAMQLQGLYVRLRV
ncbi:putative RST domain-containing protein [Helianthus annuus]|nr:putative RST domain-containing protein [Helianthus annuus]